MTDNTHMTNFFINAFYHSKFRDKLFVVKCSGDVVEDDTALEGLIADIKKLTLHGIKVILIYGGGKATDKALEARGIEIKKEGGRRITDAATLEVMKEVIGGTLSLKVHQAMTRIGAEGLSFNAVPSDWLHVHKRPPQNVDGKEIDFGYVGDIESARTRMILRTMRNLSFVAMPCLACDEDGEIYNINADTIATDIAIGAEADKLLFLSNIDGVQVDSKTAFMITSEEIPELISNGTATGGMKVKLENCRRALEGGVRRIHLINGLRAHALDEEIFETVGPGTMLMKQDETQNYLNEVEIQKAINA